MLKHWWSWHTVSLVLNTIWNVEQILTCCSPTCRHNNFSVIFVVSVKQLTVGENHEDKEVRLFCCTVLSLSVIEIYRFTFITNFFILFKFTVVSRVLSYSFPFYSVGFNGFVSFSLKRCVIRWVISEALAWQQKLNSILLESRVITDVVHGYFCIYICKYGIKSCGLPPLYFQSCDQFMLSLWIV